MSRPSEPVETTSISSITSPSPSRMIVPLPYCFSICARAACSAFCFSVLTAGLAIFVAVASMGGGLREGGGIIEERLDVCTVTQATHTRHAWRGASAARKARPYNPCATLGRSNAAVLPREGHPPRVSSRTGRTAQGGPHADLDRRRRPGAGRRPAALVAQCRLRRR